MLDILHNAWFTLTDVLSPHGPAVNAAKTYSPADFSVHFFLQLAVIILACRVVGWLGQKFLHQPQVVGEMIAGVVLGPSLLGCSSPISSSRSSPRKRKNVLYVGAQLGVGLYMFMVGLTLAPRPLPVQGQERRERLVRRHRRAVPDRRADHAVPAHRARACSRRGSASSTPPCSWARASP
jgi:hypothetical protein